MKKFYTLSLILLCCLGGTLLTAQSQQYLHFDRVDDFIEVPDASAYVAGSSEISMTGWFYTDALEYGQGMMGFRAGGTGQGEMYLIQLNNGTLESRFINSSGFYEYVGGNFTILPAVWQHVAWIYDGSKVELFIDGESVGSTPADGVIDSVNKPFGIGKSIQGTFNFVFGGRMDEVTLWSKALTADDLQDIMENELNGDEEGLELYYKFNQGVPGGDNTSITQIVSEVGAPERNGDLINFALTGETSNFLGELDDSFQAISFPVIPNKLVTDAPFDLEAEASSGLEVEYTIVSGPATVSGNTVTLDGTAGTVTVRASQSGNGQYEAAEDVELSFEVLDPQTFTPVTEARNPLAGEVFVPELGPIQLAAISAIDFPELFDVGTVTFEVDGTEIAATDHFNHHYTAWWTPPAYGSYTLHIIAENNYGATSTESITFNVVNTTESMTANAGDEVWLSGSIAEAEVEIELPSYMGAFDQIIGNLDITCPSGGCDPWDRISGIEVKAHNGQWYEIIRYITPYGVACNSSIDLTDFMSLLQGKVTFRYYLGTQGNGFEYTLNLDYQSGTPTHKYSTVTKLWNADYPFGDPGNLTPVPDVNLNLPASVEAAKLKLVSTGHGWGDNNTGNAAEFQDNTHHIHVNGVETFEQHNWVDCNPNPDGCQPQNGTWFFDRAGWCPGTIAQFFDYDMTEYAGNGIVMLGYKFDETYTDFCHANNPDCINAVTCPDCDDGFNPLLDVASFLISYGDVPLGTINTGTEDLSRADFRVFPNPTDGTFTVSTNDFSDIASVRIMNSLGQTVRVINLAYPISTLTVNLTDAPKGVYLTEVRTTDGATGMRKVVVE